MENKENVQAELDGIKKTDEGNITNQEENVANDAKSSENGSVSMEEFLSNEKNREKARQDAYQLWAIMGKNISIEKASEVKFNVTQVVHKTNLSHKKAKTVLQILTLFKFITLEGKLEFRFTFSDEDKVTYVLKSLRALSRMMREEWKNLKSVSEKVIDTETMESEKQDIINEIFG